MLPCCSGTGKVGIRYPIRSENTQVEMTATTYNARLLTELIPTLYAVRHAYSDASRKWHSDHKTDERT